ncbi:MAG: cellulose binding domain-containing protein, partial [Lachnospiraceae bacterium]|nr:cellulose binding domain-containing protein [Lachnospiraceae bacterium]
MKKHKKMKQTKRILTMVLASAILSTLVPPSFIETVHAAVIQETQEEEPWYQIKGKINSSWGGHIAGEIIITNSSNVSVQGWQIDFPWDAKITSMWNGICQQIGNWYLISPMDYNTTLAAGESVT